MPSVIVRAAAVLCLHATLVLPASALAHGHAHHELAHIHHLADAAVPAGVGEVEPEDGSDHHHAVASPVLPARFATTTGFAEPSAFEASSVDSARVSSAQPTSLDARAPPDRTPPTDSRPRSPPAV